LAILNTEINSLIDSGLESNGSLPKGALRIAYCLPKVAGGADLLQQMQIATGLQARGHALTFVAPRDLTETVCTGDLQIPTLAARTWSKTGWFNVARKITWRVQQQVGVPYLNVFSNYSFYDACSQCLPGHDVVQERNGLYKMGVAMACKRLKLPYILFFDADDIFEQDFLGRPIKGILRWRAKQIIQFTLTAANGIITVSDATKMRLANVWQVPPEKIVVFPNGVDVHRHRPYPDERKQIRASLGIGEHPLFIFVGSFQTWHDVTTLLDAFAIVLKAHPDARLLLVGDGPQRQAMMQHAANLGLGDAVQFTGLRPHSEIPHLVSAADVAVAPYPKMEHAWWGSSMKLFEYMASGVAIVASNVGQQVAEVIRDRTNGLLVAPGDASALAAACAHLISNPDLRFRLGQEARKDAVGKYSWDQYITRLERVYDAVINRRPIYSI
jgi:glycosyltransferase involved in cell wall biosynthesis